MQIIKAPMQIKDNTEQKLIGERILTEHRLPGLLLPKGEEIVLLYTFCPADGLVEQMQPPECFPTQRTK